MFGIENYAIFILSGILLNLTPGSDTMYILGRSISQGRKAGVLSVLGISTGSIIHTLLVSFGLSAILVGSATAFSIIKYTGCAYLAFIGIKSLLSTTEDISPGEARKEAPYKIYIQGMITNLLNPKVALFFLAFLPQFVNPATGFGPVPFIILGITFITTGTLWCLVIAVFSSYATEKLRSRPAVVTAMNKLAGIIFLGLGLGLLRVKATS